MFNLYEIPELPSNIVLVQSDDQLNDSLQKAEGKWAYLLSSQALLIIYSLHKLSFNADASFYNCVFLSLDDSSQAIFYFTAAWCGPCKLEILFNHYV